MAGMKTILLVDDDRDIVSGLQAALEAKGYRVLTAHDGNAGLALAETGQPELVIVDMMMPHKSGFLVLETLKRRGPASPKIVMITANEGSRHRAYAEMLGADDYLRKPFALDELLGSVSRLCPLPAVTNAD
jgi:DNA-binding response OmpR family regulator